MKKIHKIENGFVDERLDSYLAKTYPDYSRSFFQKLIKSGYVKINENPARQVKPNYRLKHNDKIELVFPEIEPKYYDSSLLNIIYEDNALLVINKPAGISVHPASKRIIDSKDNITILDILTDKYPEIDRKSFFERPFIVHRLDKDTSGVMVIAKTPQAQFNLMQQFSNRSIKKTYLGIVYGKFTEKKGTIEAPLSRAYRNTRKVSIGYGRMSTTKFRILKMFDEYTLLEITPITGRTHQIRVHLSSIGHPILGDKTYLTTPTAKVDEFNSIANLVKRQMLHSYKLVLNDPKTNNKKEFVAKLPDDFSSVTDYLKKSR